MILKTEPLPNRGSIWLVNLFFGAGPAPTGNLADSLAHHLQQADFHVEVITGKSQYHAMDSGAAPRFSGRIHRLYSSNAAATGVLGRFLCWMSFYLAVFFFALFRKWPDRIVIMTTPPFLHAVFVAIRKFRGWRTRLYLWNQDTYPEVLDAVGLLRRRSLLYRLVNRIQCWATSRVDRVFVLDEAMRRILHNHGAADIRITPNWQTDDSSATRVWDDELQALVSRARASYRFLVLYTGNFGWGHDLRILFEYLRAQPTQRDFFFLFVGGGEKWDRVAEIVQQGVPGIGIHSYVAKSRLDDLIGFADFGLVALEAQCAGMLSPSKIHGYLWHAVPLLYLGPETSNVAEAIDDFRCGFRIPENDSNCLQSVLATIAATGFKRHDYAMAAKRASDERYSELVAVKRMIGAITDSSRAPCSPMRFH